MEVSQHSVLYVCTCQKYNEMVKLYLDRLWETLYIYWMELLSDPYTCYGAISVKIPLLTDFNVLGVSKVTEILFV